MALQLATVADSAWVVVAPGPQTLRTLGELGVAMDQQPDSRRGALSSRSRFSCTYRPTMPDDDPSLELQVGTNWEIASWPPPMQYPTVRGRGTFTPPQGLSHAEMDVTVHSSGSLPAPHDDASPLAHLPAMLYCRGGAEGHVQGAERR